MGLVSPLGNWDKIVLEPFGSKSTTNYSVCQVVNLFSSGVVRQLGERWMRRVGEKLYQLRQRHNLTTRELAEKLQTSHTQILRIEKGVRQPSGDLILRMAQFFQVSLDRLMQDDLEIDWRIWKTNLMKQIGEKLQTLRLRRGLTMSQLAEQLDTSHAQISRVENGQRKPSAELVFKISTFFAVPVEQLMRDDRELEGWALDMASIPCCRKLLTSNPTRQNAQNLVNLDQIILGQINLNGLTS